MYFFYQSIVANMKLIWRRSIFYLLILIIISFSVHNSQAKTIYGEQAEPDFPYLEIIKLSSETETLLGNTITVNVNITNWSDYSAFNLTITEPLFSDWAYSTFNGWDDYIWVEVSPGASITYSYNMTVKNEGKYTIAATKIDYLDENSTSFNARSQFIPITIFVTEPPITQDEIWSNILKMAILIVAIPGLVYGINKFGGLT